MLATNRHPANGPRNLPWKRFAFSVVELMLAISIMGVIVFALYSVFNQTQRAMRSTQIQNDVSEKARAIMEMLAREIEQTQPTYSSIVTNNIVVNEVNLLGGPEYRPLPQRSDRDDVEARTNFLYNVFFLNRFTNSWYGIGYRLVNVTNGVGTLLRYETNLFGRVPQDNELFRAFDRETRIPNSTNFHHVADGVIHFRLMPYGPFGYPLAFDHRTNYNPNLFVTHRSDVNGNVLPASDVIDPQYANVRLQEGFQGVALETRFNFSSNALPSYLEVELGMLEPEALKQYYVMVEEENPNAAKFLERQISKVHLFRQRIPIRTAAQ